MQIQCQYGQIHITGAFSVTEDGTFDSGSAGHQCHFGGGDSASLVVMGVQTDDCLVSIRIMFAEILDHIGVLVGRSTLNGSGQIEDKFAWSCRLPCLFDALAYIDNEIEVAVGKLFRRELIEHMFHETGLFDSVANHGGSFDSHLFYFVAIFIEDEFAVQVAGSDVAMNDSLLHPFQSFDSAVDQVLSGLCQDRYAHVIGDEVLLYQPPAEVKILLRGGWESHFDLFKSYFDQHFKVVEFSIAVHRYRQSLITVAQVNAHPCRSLGQNIIRPLPVGNFNRFRLSVFWKLCHNFIS